MANLAIHLTFAKVHIPELDFQAVRWSGHVPSYTGATSNEVTSLLQNNHNTAHVVTGLLERNVAFYDDLVKEADRNYTQLSSNEITLQQARGTQQNMAT